MADLPDYYTQVTTLAPVAYSFRHGADAAKPGDPDSGDIYFATDTKILYVCVADGAWTGFDADILVQGTLKLYENMNANSKKIINLAAPTLPNDAVRKVYADGLVTTHAGLTTGIHGVGASTIASVANLTTHAGLTTGIHGVGASTIASLLQLTTHAALTTTTHGVGAGAIVGTTLAQTLTNKTLTSPIINIIDAQASSLHIYTTGHIQGLKIVCTSDDNIGGYLLTNHISTSPAVGDAFFLTHHYARNSVNAETLAASYFVQWDDPTSGSEDSSWHYKVRRAGAWVEAMVLSSDGKLWLLGGKEFFVQVVEGHEALTLRGYRGTSILNTVNDACYFNFSIPADFNALTSCVVVFWGESADTIDWTASTHFGAEGEALDAHSDTATDDGVEVADEVIQEADVSLAFTAIAAGDYVGLRFILDALLDAGIAVFGLKFKYT